MSEWDEKAVAGAAAAVVVVVMLLLVMRMKTTTRTLIDNLIRSWRITKRLAGELVAGVSLIFSVTPPYADEIRYCTGPAPVEDRPARAVQGLSPRKKPWTQPGQPSSTEPHDASYPQPPEGIAAVELVGLLLSSVFYFLHMRPPRLTSRSAY